MTHSIEQALQDALPMKHTQSVIEEIYSERVRQKSDEGWTVEHDDQHDDGSLAAAAACYANPLQVEVDEIKTGIYFDRFLKCPDFHLTPIGWPYNWDSCWWKPTNRRRDLIKAAALIVAEIERLDRAA